MKKMIKETGAILIGAALLFNAAVMEGSEPLSSNAAGRGDVSLTTAQMPLEPLSVERTKTVRPVVPDLITANPGETVGFGCYEQDGNPENGPEAIEWTVLEKNAGELLLLSNQALDCHAFFIPGTVDAEESVQWENSDLRDWLSNDFAEEAFSEKEWNRVLEPEYENALRTRDGLMAAVQDTKDPVTVMGFDELEKYFPDKVSRKCDLSERAKKKGAEELYWLRTVSAERECYAVRMSDGVVGTVPVTSETLSVRPMIRISMYQNDSGREMDCNDPELIKKVQAKLNELGYACGETDGTAGKATEAALIRYQMAEGLPVSGVVNPITVESLGI